MAPATAKPVCRPSPFNRLVEVVRSAENSVPWRSVFVANLTVSIETPGHCAVIVAGRRRCRLNLDRKLNHNKEISLWTKSIQSIKEVSLKLPSAEVLNSSLSVSIETDEGVWAL